MVFQWPDQPGEGLFEADLTDLSGTLCERSSELNGICCAESIHRAHLCEKHNPMWGQKKISCWSVTIFGYFCVQHLSRTPLHQLEMAAVQGCFFFQGLSTCWRSSRQIRLWRPDGAVILNGQLRRRGCMRLWFLGAVDCFSWQAVWKWGTSKSLTAQSSCSLVGLRYWCSAQFPSTLWKQRWPLDDLNRS